jgi:hypothetical protein
MEINKDKLLIFISVGAMFSLVLFLIIVYYFARLNNVSLLFNGAQESEIKKNEFIYFSHLTGEGVLSQEEENPKVVAVMINNNPEGHPLSGINDAGVVYEIPVEGSFTRFMAIYPENSAVEEVGPVRSARPYYLDWLAEYGDAMYMHCGGSQESLTLIKKRKIFDADEFSRTKYFWRDNSRLAPHNLYTNAEKWRQYFLDYGGNREFAEWIGWKFGDLSASGTESVNLLSVGYSKNFNVSWSFDAEKNNYIRQVNENIFLDKKSQPIITSNIIVQFTAIKIIDELGRREIETIGQGEARVFRNGLMVRGKWKKETLDSRTLFFDLEGNEIELEIGQTWLMVVPLKTNIIVSN